MAETPSEKLFEQYLDNHGHAGAWKHHPPISGQSTTPDYKLTWQKKKLFFEVKEMTADNEQLPPIGRLFIDPFAKTRRKINEGRRKFKALVKYPCSIVLHNINDEVPKLDPLHVFAAMLGDLGYEMDFDDDKGEVNVSTMRNIFLDGGKMVDPKSRRVQNTTISSLIILSIYYDTKDFETRQQKTIDDREEVLGRELNPTERTGAYVDTPREKRIGVPRSCVMENPVARVSFPDGLFCGEYDERWRLDETTGEPTCVFKGEALK